MCHQREGTTLQFIDMSQEDTEYNKDTDASLIKAAAGGDETIVRLLLEKGANTEATDGDGNTPLIAAAESGHEAVVRLLLEHGANIEAKDKYDNTPLIKAADHGHEAVVRLLLEHGANSDATNREGYTAYDCAKKTSIRQLLRSY